MTSAITGANVTRLSDQQFQGSPRRFLHLGFDTHGRLLERFDLHGWADHMSRVSRREGEPSAGTVIAWNKRVI